MCEAHIELAETPEPMADKPDLIGRRITKYVLSGMKDGKPTEIDLLALGTKGLEGANAFLIENKPGVAYNSDKNNKNFVAISSLESPLDASTFLHEFGHSKQNRDPRFKNIAENYSLLSVAQEAPKFLNHERLSSMFGSINIELAPTQQALLDRLKTLEEKGLNLRVDGGMQRSDLEATRNRQNKGDIANWTKSIKDLEDALIKNDADSKQLERELLETKTQIAKDLETLIELPKKMLERDATARAFKDMRTVRQEAGINLFAPIKIKQEEMNPLQQKFYKVVGEVKSCKSSVKDALNKVWSRLKGEKTIVTSAQRDLGNFALFTYGATKEDMRKTYGKMPTPKVDAEKERADIAARQEKAELVPEDEVIELLDAEVEEVISRPPPTPPPIAIRRAA